jgi:hypothetical protein
LSDLSTCEASRHPEQGSQARLQVDGERECLLIGQLDHRSGLLVAGLALDGEHEARVEAGAGVLYTERNRTL